MTKDGSIAAKLENAAERILAYGSGTGLSTRGRHARYPEYLSNHEAGTLEILRAVIDLEDEHILAFIEPDGTLTVRQNWGEVGQTRHEEIVLEPSEESRAAYTRIASRLAGKIPHPPVEWTIEQGPWCVARMNGEVIVEAGAARNYHQYVIAFPDGRTVHSFHEAEKLMERLYPQYSPISLEPARRQLGWPY